MKTAQATSLKVRLQKIADEIDAVIEDEQAVIRKARGISKKLKTIADRLDGINSTNQRREGVMKGGDFSAHQEAKKLQKQLHSLIAGFEQLATAKRIRKKKVAPKSN
jgi:hypothetical protein